MAPVSSHVVGSIVKPYVASSTKSEIPKLKRSISAAFKLASAVVPAVVRVIQDVEDDSGAKRVPGMERMAT